MKAIEHGYLFSRKPARTIVAGVLLCIIAVVGFRAPACASSLTASPNPGTVGAPITFDYATLTDPPIVLDFGDNTGAVVLPSDTGSKTHVFTSIGFYIVRLCQTSCTGSLGMVLAVKFVTVRATAPNVPFGSIFSTSVLGGPFLAGADSQINVSFRIATQSAPFASTPQTELEVVVDLEDSRGNLIRRSDPFVIPAYYAAGGRVVQRTIPYTIPGDARGAYQIRVYIQTDGGATVAIGHPIPFVIVGGPDPSSSENGTFHANGSIITGPSSSSFRSAPSVSTSSFQSNVTTALEWPDKTLSLGALYDPVSNRADPVFTLASATPGPVAAPDAAPQTQSEAGSAAGGKPQYTDVLGRATASLPQLLGGGTTLRGLDLTYKYADGWSYHGAAGYTQLGTTTTSLRAGSAFDISRSWSSTDSLRLSYFGQSDDVAKFVPNGSGGPKAANTGALEFNDEILKNLKTVISVGQSQSHLKIPLAPTKTDAADKIGMQYLLGSVNVAADYHNYGADFAVGGGPGAISDAVGSLATASAYISPASSLSLTWQRDDKRSTLSRRVDDSATFSTQPASGIGMHLTATHDHMIVAGSNLTTDSLDYGFNRTWQNGGYLSLNGSDSGSLDTLTPSNSITVRNTDVSYVLQRGSQLVGGGVSALVTTGQFFSNSTVSDNITYGFSFGGWAGVTRAYELQLQALGDNAVQFGGRSRDSLYSAILSRHLTRQTALGLRVQTGKHVDQFSALNSTTTAVRLQLNLNY